MSAARALRAHPPALSAAALPAGHHDARTQGGHHGYEEGSYIGSVNVAGSIYKQFGNSVAVPVFGAVAQVMQPHIQALVQPARQRKAA